MTRFRVVLSADWHLDARTGGVERREEIKRAVMDGPVRAAVEGKADLFAFLGDLCDPGSRFAVSDVAFPIEVALRLSRAGGHPLAGRDDPGIPSAWVAGNHDVVLSESVRTTLDPLAEVAGSLVAGSCVVAREPLVAREAVVNLLLVPYVAAPARSGHGWGGDGSFWPGLKLDPGLPLVVLGHCTSFPSSITPGSEAAEFERGRGQEWPAGVGRVAPVFRANGHLHEPQEVELPGGGTVHVPGSLVRLHFGDSERGRGFSLIDLEV